MPQIPALPEVPMDVAVDQQLANELAAEPSEASPTSRFEELLARMRAGCPDAAQEIVETYGPHIRAVVKRRLGDSLRRLFDSEDFVQSAWKSLLCMPAEKIDTIQDPRSLVKLLATIAARKVIDEYRRRTQKACDITRRRPLDDPEVLAALADVAGINTPSQLCIAREKQEIFRQRWEDLVNREPPRNQRIVYLRMGGFPYAQIAETEDISERQAQRIMSKLFRSLSDTDRAA